MAVIKKSNQFDIEETFRNLRTNIEFSNVDEDIRVINLTSTTKNEGKSTIAVNLAKMYATKYPKVLLVDCDLRNSSVHTIVNISNANGLTNILATIKNVETLDNLVGINTIESETGYPLTVITSGSRVPNPTEILSSKRFKKFIELARKEFNYIIIDCPPVGIVADAVPVSSMCDGTLYVVSSDENQKKTIKMSMDGLKRNGANILGVILNKVDSSVRKYGYGDRYGYGYGYGDK